MVNFKSSQGGQFSIVIDTSANSGGANAAGVTFEALRDVLRLQGQPRETAWPYGEAASIEQDPERFQSNSKYLDPLDTPEIIATLTAGHLLVGGFALTQEFLDANSWLLPNTYTPPAVGLHAMAIVGYLSGSGVTGFILRNSWGVSWGDNGYACMPLSYFNDSCTTCLQLKE